MDERARFRQMLVSQIVLCTGVGAGAARDIATKIRPVMGDRRLINILAAINLKHVESQRSPCAS